MRTLEWNRERDGEGRVVLLGDADQAGSADGKQDPSGQDPLSTWGIRRPAEPFRLRSELDAAHGAEQSTAPPNGERVPENLGTSTALSDERVRNIHESVFGPSPFNDEESYQVADSGEIATDAVVADGEEGDELAMGQFPKMYEVGKELLKKWQSRTRPKPKKGNDRYKKDNAGNEFVQLDDGKVDLGEIDLETALEIGMEAAPIRLRRGSHDEGTEKGEGDIHVEARHGDQIRAIVDSNGNQIFEDVAEYVEFVAENWTEIRSNRAGNPVLIVRDPAQAAMADKQQVLIVELTESAAVRDKGGDPNGPDIEPLGKDGKMFKAKDGSVINQRVSDKNGPTLEIHPRKNPRLRDKQSIKRRYLGE